MTVMGTSPEGATMEISLDCLAAGFRISVVTPAYPAGTLTTVSRIDLDMPAQLGIDVRGLVDIPPSTIEDVVDYEVPVRCLHEYILAAWTDVTPTMDPWLNRGGGTAVPNGTSTHTVDFGFTATAGSLLVLVAAGNSTAAHTVSGYTQQVDSGNAYGHVTVLTKTAAGGETSAPIGHTGTGANVAWQIYEFPASATWTASAQLADSTTTFPALSGLPGSSAPQLVMAAFARGSLNTASAGASAAGWTGTTVEHADAYVMGGSAGFWMANAHEVGVTATSVTPAATITGSGNFTASPWIKVVFAIDTPAISPPPGPYLVDELRLRPPETLMDNCGLTQVMRDLLNPQETIDVSFCLGQIGEMEYEIRSGVFNVIGRRDPVVVVDAQEYARGTLRFISRTRDELYDLRKLLTVNANPMLLQIRHLYELGTHGVLYFMPLKVSERWLPDGRIPQHVFEVDFVEISAPPVASVFVKSGIPFDVAVGDDEFPNGGVKQRYPTFNDMALSGKTFSEVYFDEP